MQGGTDGGGLLSCKMDLHSGARPGPLSLGTASPDDKMIPADKYFAGNLFINGSDLTQEHRVDREAGKRAKCNRIHPKIPTMTHPTP